MINLPEPVAWIANYGGNVYTEAQLKQAVYDTLEEAKSLISKLDAMIVSLKPYEIVNAIEALKGKL